MKKFMESFKNLDNKKKSMLIGISAFMVLLVVAGVTYAYYTAFVTENNKTESMITTNKLSIVFDGSQEIEANSITPGWHAEKKFTVENTSDTDLTFDINLINVVNNFEGSDLKYSLNATYVEGANGSTQAGTVQMVTAGSTAVSDRAHRADLSISGVTVPTAPNSVANDGTETPSTTPSKVVTIYIPKRAKISFTMPYVFEYKPAVDQNIDQGKKFKATISITANAADNNSGVVTYDTYAESVGYTNSNSKNNCTTVDCSVNEIYDEIMGGTSGF